MILKEGLRAPRRTIVAVGAINALIGEARAGATSLMLTMEDFGAPPSASREGQGQGSKIGSDLSATT